MQALGMIETKGTLAAVEAADAMLKAADVRLIHIERRLGGRLVTMVVDGTVADVQAAAEAGKEAASHIGKVKLSEVLPRPHPEVKKFLYTNVKEE